MSLKYKPLDSITEKDLQDLKDNKVAEGKHIEYKEVLLGNSDDDKREFLADVSSFANSSGGDLIFGIAQNDEGEPKDICGIQPSSIDAEMLRLESTIRDNIDPRILGIQPKPLQLSNGKWVIILRIPKSWAAPHMITFKKYSRFFFRDSRGKHQMDIDEIRTAFQLSATTADHIRNFRTERISKISSKDTPIDLPDGGKIILHIVPFSSFDPGARIDFNFLPKESSPDFILTQTITKYAGSRRPNFDGRLFYTSPDSRYSPNVSDSYLQIFRNGIIESVDSFLLSGWGLGQAATQKLIPSIAYEQKLIEVLPRYLKLQKILGVQPPAFIMLSMLNVKGFRMETGKTFFSGPGYPIDRDNLLVSEIEVQDFECNAAETLRPIFDTIWNATGWERSMNYDETGKWIVKN